MSSNHHRSAASRRKTGRRAVRSAVRVAVQAVRRLRPAAVVLVLVASLVQVTVVGAGTTPAVAVAPAPAAAPTAAAPGSITLDGGQRPHGHGSGPGLIHESDPITDVQVDRSTATTPATPAPRRTRSPTAACRRAAPGGSSDPNFADTCQWPSHPDAPPGTRRSWPRATETDLSDGQGARQPPRRAST